MYDPYFLLEKAILLWSDGIVLGIHFVDTYSKNDLQNMCTKDILLSIWK